MDWKPLPRITQLLQHLRETQRAELACARRMVEVYNLGHKRLICASLLQDTSVGIVIAERQPPHVPTPFTLTTLEMLRYQKQLQRAGSIRLRNLYLYAGYSSC